MLTLTTVFAFWLGRCPLTDLEWFLWDAAGQETYSGGFITHYLSEIVYWNISPNWLLLAVVLWTGTWVGLYARLWVKESKKYGR